MSRRTFEELETLAYIEGKNLHLFAMLDVEIGEQAESMHAEFFSTQTALEHAEAEVRGLQADLDVAVKRIVSLETSLRQIHNLSTLTGGS